MASEATSSSSSSHNGPPGAPQHRKFADYFVICGLDLDTGLEPDRFSGDSLHCSPLDRAYKSKPLAHYPENVPWNPFDSHGICMLSLPQGLKFRTQKHNIEPKFHAFATTREDGKRCYGFSLVFYEEVRNRNICSAMHTLQSMFITELSSRQNGPGLRRVKENPASRSLPRHFKLAAHAPNSALSYYDITKDKLYVAKSISLICQMAYVNVAEVFLKNLYKCLPRQPGPGLSLESYVYNILHEVSIPDPGRSIRIYLPPEESHQSPLPTLLQCPNVHDELPLMDFPTRLMFSYLGIECVIQLFTCVLLENQVLLRSADYNKLMVVAECITNLLFPFTWPHVYAPILPASLYHFLDAPVPFVMGLHADAETNMKIGTEATLCYVDIDRKIIQLPEELPSFPHRADFVMELAAVLDKFQVPRDKTAEQSTIIQVPPRRSDQDPMTASCTLPSGMHVRRKHSLHDILDWDRSASPEPQQPPGSPSNGPRSEALQKIVDIVRRSGVSLDEVDFRADIMPPSTRKTPVTPQEQYCDDLRLNNAIREIFLNRFVQMFSAYEQFVIQPNQGREEWLSNRESLQNFDKASFLSDQPQHHRPFLSRFLESQMFATLIDNKIMSAWTVEGEEVDHNLKLFDDRIKLLRKRFGGESIIRTSNYEPCISARETLKILEKRLNSVDMEVAPPSEILPNRPAYFRSFPILDKSVLNQESASRGNSLRRVKNGAKWRVKEISLEGKPPEIPSSNRQPASLTTNEMNPTLLAQANWTFVEKLLKDCKSKTKRMLLEKMGSEAVELGLSGEVSVNGVEENTLIASLCDLLEKIWSHGMQNKQGKSALWNHLQSYLEIQECTNTSKPIDNNYLTPELPYRVVIFPSKRTGSANTSANVWVAISGNNGETQQVSVPRGTLEFVFHHKNLGVLTTLRIGHDNSGLSPKWMVEHVVVRNEVTGHTYKFPCGRWLGRGVDDGSTERLLVGQLVPRSVDNDELIEACRTPPRARSPSIHRPEVKPSEIQHLLGDAVNAIVKWHYRPSRERDAGSLTNLLCGEEGLVKCLEQAFLFGFRSTRLFGRNLYIWDYFVRVKEQFELNLVEESVEAVRGGGSVQNSPPTNSSGSSPESSFGTPSTPASRQEFSTIWRCYCHLMDEINNVTQSLGKDGKFQLFICLSLREHLLHRMLVPIAASRVTQEMYEEQSFMRKKGLLTFLRQILEPLDEFHIVLENSITQGIPSHC
ncbi:DENN domain-containing protein 5A isoform X3 [Phlebotomus papatasi]|uniref:DENN domain-containing protein 5A isoform X3 n=1 Tax=Phlebotomus papatasi TaxID=29031 RepID=UPI0024837E58|nr:DENN domain-containing protein 5A isoform X3 [Phlebotomus papatasi]